MNDQWGDPRNYDPNVDGYDPYTDPNVWGNPYEPPPAYVEPSVTPPAVTPPTTTTTNTGGGKTPEQIEAEGREYDRQHGLIGGYMLNGVWVNGSPYGGGGGGTDGGGFDGLDAGAPEPFNWSQFRPTPFAYADYVPKFGPFSAPSMQEAENDPGYQFARDQGRKALESSAAGRGVLRTGGTLKDILEYGNKFGEQNYNSVFNRKYQTWQGNNEWDRNNYVTNRDTAFGVYDRNYRGEKDAFDYLHDSESRTFADIYNRWRDKLNSLTQIATAGANG